MYAEGDYKVAVEVLRFGLSGKKETEQMEVVFFVDENTRRSAFLYFTEATEDRSTDVLEALGFNGDFGSPAIDSKYYAGYELDARCKHEDYQGQPKERWEIGPAVMGKPAPTDLVSRRNAQWRSRHKPAAPKPAGKPPTPPAATERAPASKGPPPKREPTKPAAPAFGKEEAFDAIAKEMGDVGVDTDEWNTAIDAVGEDEDKFTAEQWREVVRKYLKDAAPF